MRQDRFFIDNYGENDKSIHKVFDFASKSTFSNCYLVLNDDKIKRDLNRIPFFNDINDKSFETYGKHYNVISFNEIVRSSSLPESLIISLWLNDEKLFKIGEISGIREIIGIPWHETSLKLWKLAFGPTNIETLKREQFLTVSDLTLRQCFEELTKERINWTTLHSEDIQDIKLIIENNKNSAVPLEIFSYLMREKNLSYKRSLELKNWTEKLLSGR